MGLADELKRHSELRELHHQQRKKLEASWRSPLWFVDDPRPTPTVAENLSSALESDRQRWHQLHENEAAEDAIIADVQRGLSSGASTRRRRPGTRRMAQPGNAGGSAEAVGEFTYQGQQMNRRLRQLARGVGRSGIVYSCASRRRAPRLRYADEMMHPQW